jgi:hypothetical protein
MAEPEQLVFPTAALEAAFAANTAAEVAKTAAVRATNEVDRQLALPPGQFYQYRLAGDENVCFPGISAPRQVAGDFSGQLVVGNMIIVPTGPYLDGAHNHAHFYPYIVHNRPVTGDFVGIRQQTSRGIALGLGVAAFESTASSIISRDRARALAAAGQIVDPRSFPYTVGETKT